MIEQDSIQLHLVNPVILSKNSRGTALMKIFEEPKGLFEYFYGERG